MDADPSSDCCPTVAPSCYFTIAVPASSAHFSTETPSISPVSEYTHHTYAEPTNPLLALRQTPPKPMSSPPDASRLLQLQTSAAHRPGAEPLQSSSSASSTTSNDTSSSSRRSSALSSSVLSCCRCRRESLMGMIQFSTNTYYCSHCARMVGYSAG
ncbi:hypothetical protein BDU57DRAFT_520753 [Ampelomyces quisqualis]|uniref:Uncharacterized protein n=1 Tax=Ampelomyces quisqualis TaxID=50730 RepID=A0A6A5QEC2_AMPQU|nr:hypothetical protein BDU57DRAFT_520753 [Ampelomyces quisqualis]